MSEATQELTRLVGKLSLQQRKHPRLTLDTLAYSLIEEISSDKERLDKVLASAKLNRAQFINEAATAQRRDLHQAIVNAALKYSKDQADKDGRHGILLR